MNVLKKLSDKVSDKPYHGLPKLPRGYHDIVCFHETSGKYGKSVIAELQHELIYLPSYIVEKLSSDDIVDLNQCEENLYLFFGGRKKKNK